MAVTEDVKMEPSEDDSSSTSSSSSSSKSSSSRRSGDWTDEEGERSGARNGKKSKERGGSSLFQDAESETTSNRKKRTRPPRRFTGSRRDYNRFDRPDMYVNDLFSYMGMYLAPDPTRKPARIQAFSYTNKTNSKIIRLSVEGGVIATGSELFGALQKTILDRSDNSDHNEQSKLPSVINLRGQSLTVDYSPPHGDEICFGSHAQDCSWIGQNFLGTVFVSPSRPSQHPHKTDLSRAWQYEWSYKSWHQPTLPGMVLPAHTTLPALPRRRRKTDQDSSSATVEKHRIKSDVD